MENTNPNRRADSFNAIISFLKNQSHPVTGSLIAQAACPKQSMKQTATDICDLCREGKVKRSLRGRNIVYSLIE